MTTSLVQTKLYIPRVRSELVPRPRLIQRLNEGSQRRLTLLSAPAGFGKTTLLSEWANTDGAGMRFAWVSLDNSDNDPVRFLAYLVAAFRGFDDNIGAGVLSALQLPKPPSKEELLTTLINQISTIPSNRLTGPASTAGVERGTRRSLGLVLDDYHVITARAIHGALEYLLDFQPANLHLVIATRSDPPLHLARLRGRGQLTELRAPELRFTHQEIATLLNTVLGLNLPPEQVVALANRTEGWIASLQMAAISMRGRKRTLTVHDVSSFIEAFTGSHRFILDYLVEEVLDQQPPGIQEFLLQTAVLERMTGPLCDAIIGRDNGSSKAATGLSAESALPVPSAVDRGEAEGSLGNGQSTLEQLERANLFIVPMDDERRWYRYHHLFADLLRQRLRQQVGAEGLASLHRRASVWYEQNGFVGDAVNHTLAAKDFGRAGELIERAAQAVWKRSEVVTFLSWVEALPDDAVRARPLLCVYHALALLMTGHPLEVVEARLRDVMEDDAVGAVSGELALVRGVIAVYQGDTRRSAELSRRALEILPDESLFLRSLGAGILGLAHMYRGDVVAATEALEQAAAIGLQAGNLMNTVLALCHLAELCYLQGRLREAKAYYERALHLTLNGQGRYQPIACVPLIGLGELQREWNDLEAATHHLTEGIALSKQCGEIWVMSGYLVLANVKQTQGDLDGACQAIQTAQQIAVRFDAMEMDDIKVAMHMARLWLAQGDLEAVARWAKERGLDTEDGMVELAKDGRADSPPILREYEWTALARLFIALGQPDEALKVLKPLRQKTETFGWMRLVIEILVLESLAFQAQGDVSMALASLERALSLAEPEGYVRLFVDEGEPVAGLLRQAASRGTVPKYVSQILGAFDVSKYGEPVGSQLLFTQPLVDPLSGRELEVLRLLNTHLSSPEIAAELYIATSTVRSHIKSIYSKLDVHSRTDAVQRAEELGLINTNHTA